MNDFQTGPHTTSFTTHVKYLVRLTVTRLGTNLADIQRLRLTYCRCNVVPQSATLVALQQTNIGLTFRNNWN